MNIRCGIIVFFFLSLLPVIGQSNFNEKRKLYDRNKGLVPNEIIAERIAEIILVNIYGEGVKRQKPFVIRLKNNKVWVVQGRWNSKDMNLKAGVAYMEIQKSDCKILKVTHGK
jgi:hypothetical protein